MCVTAYVIVPLILNCAHRNYWKKIFINVSVNALTDEDDLNEIEFTWQYLVGVSWWHMLVHHIYDISDLALGSRTINL